MSPLSHSGNADALVWGMMIVLSLALVLVSVHARRAVNPETRADLPRHLARLLQADPQHSTRLNIARAALPVWVIDVHGW